MASFNHIFRIIIAPLAMTACVQNFKVSPRTLVIGVESEIKSLDFRSAVDANTSRVMQLFTQGLVRVDAQLKPVPDFARAFKVDRAQVYTFDLPPDATFQDGRKALCADVRASFEQAASPNSRLHSGFTDVASFECRDANTFVIRLKRPRPSFLAGDLPSAKIMPPEFLASASVPEKIIGSGPYKFVERRGRDLLFDRVSKDARYAGFDHVIVRSIIDPTTRFLSIMGGDVDMLFNALSPGRVVESLASPELRVFRGPGNNFQYLGLNLRSAKFRDPRVRRALAISIDRADIIKNKLKGFGTAATSVLAPGNPLRDDHLRPIEYDPALAKKLLKEAGASHLEFDLKCPADADVLSTLLLIKDAWEQLGLKVNLKPYEFGTFFADVQKGNVEAYYLRWSGEVEADLLNKIFHSREFPPGRNRTYYSNPTVDRLLDIGATEPDFKRRHEIYNEVQRIVLADLPYIPLWYPDNIVVATREISGFLLHPTGTWLTALEARREMK